MIRSQITTLLQIFCYLLLYSKVIFKRMRVADDTRIFLSGNGLRNHQFWYLCIPPSGATIPGYDFRPGDCQADTVEKATKTDVKHCARECDSQDKCKGFVFDPLDTEDNCLLKGHYCPRVSADIWKYTYSKVSAIDQG